MYVCVYTYIYNIHNKHTIQYNILKMTLYITKREGNTLIYYHQASTLTLASSAKSLRSFSEGILNHFPCPNNIFVSELSLTELKYTEKFQMFLVNPVKNPQT